MLSRGQGRVRANLKDYPRALVAMATLWRGQCGGYQKPQNEQIFENVLLLHLGADQLQGYHYYQGRQG
jgi:hypothetical protein